MSLYYEAASLLTSTSSSEHSLKSRIFGSKDLKSQPKQVYALLSQAAKWSPILVDVIESSQLLQLERKLSSNVSLLLVHDLLLAKKGLSAPTSHPLRLAVERHKTRLSAELTKARLKRGFASVKDLQAHVDAGNLQTEESKNGDGKDGAPSLSAKWLHPRWVRINALKTDLREQMETTFAHCKAVYSIEELLAGCANSKEQLAYVDQDVPNLVALSSAPDLARSSAYLNGLIILQDKASCFPAYLLDPDPRNGHILDACAAPGNKTTHLAAILQERGGDRHIPNIYACERDKARAATLRQMVETAGASKLLTIEEGQDFLRLDPDQVPWKDIGALLLDPSCSGSGMVGRDETLKFMLPSRVGSEESKHHSRKRKRISKVEMAPKQQTPQEEVPISEEQPASQLSDRLSALSEIQLKLLLHAFRFPKARKITYSTCSIYAEENEHVVVRALNSIKAKSLGWQILRREQQVSGMKNWQVRGSIEACTKANTIESIEEVAEACIRCEKGTKEGTQGFFVAAFVRVDEAPAEQHPSEEEWEGFSDDVAGT